MDDDAMPQGGPDNRSWDPVVAELQRLRRVAGEPSYAEIAQRVTQRRLDQGADPHSARVARSTVYDTFRTGRARIDVDLVRDVALAVGAADADVDAWLARRGAPEPTPEDPAALRSVLLLLLGCLLLNLAGRSLVQLLDLPVHLDMIGTAIAAIALGPWRGALVGGVTNVVGVAISGPISLPFALVNVAGALLWGYGVRRWGLGRTLPRFLALNVAVAVVSTLIAMAVVAAAPGATSRPEATIVDDVLDLTRTVWVAVVLANLLVSLADKMLCGFVALVTVSALPASMRRGLPLVLASPDRAD